MDPKGKNPDQSGNPEEGSGSQSSQGTSRRAFLSGLGAVFAGAALGACQPGEECAKDDTGEDIDAYGGGSEGCEGCEAAEGCEGCEAAEGCEGCEGDTGDTGVNIM